jgi:hypothetical protein
MQMADEERWEDMMVKFASMPGVQPVKAGFMVQLAFGQLGCLDTHNVAMYRSIAKLMMKDPEADNETKEKWQDLYQMMPQKKKRDDSLSPIGDIPAQWGGGGKHGSDKTEKSVKTYMSVLNHMNKEMGITPRVLWDFWVNYVSQRYENNPDNQYSREQGTSYAPDDPQLMGVLGGKDRQWQRERGGRRASVIDPHPSSGGVSRVHLMAAITPADLLSQMQTNLGNKYHIVNAALRSDKDGAPALATLSARILDQAKLQDILASGANINPAMRNAKTENKKRIEKLREGAEKALYWIFTNKYQMKPQEAQELISIYTVTLEKLYFKHIREIKAHLKSQATKVSQKSGDYIYDKEKMGYGVDTYDTNKPFSIGGVGKIASRISQLNKKVEPYIEPMQQQRELRIGLDRNEKMHTNAVTKLNARLIGTEEKPGPATLMRIIKMGGGDMAQKREEMFGRKMPTLESAKKKYAAAFEKWSTVQTEKPRTTKDKQNRERTRANFSVARKDYSEMQRAYYSAEDKSAALQVKIKQHQAEVDTAKEKLKGVGIGVKRQATAELKAKSDRARKTLHGKSIYDAEDIIDDEG